MNLHEFLDQEEQINDESFQIDDEQKANWALRKIKQLQEQQKENEVLAQAEMDKIETWVQQEYDKAQNSIDYFQGLLAKYAMKQREINPDFKSQKLPYGRIRFVKQRPQYKYDDDLLVESLKKQGETELIRIKETPDKTAIKKKFVVHNGGLVNPETGEKVDGVKVIERDEKFEVVTD